MSSRIYLDNAATTPIDPSVVEAMMPYLTDHFGNPSSIYSYGRENRLAIEKARKSVASILHAHPSEIFFTSGGTESSNTAIFAAVRELKCKRIITSPIEHHATLHTCTYLETNGEAELAFLNILPNGHVDLADLEEKLAGSDQKTLVTLMHANNEIGKDFITGAAHKFHGPKGVGILYINGKNKIHPLIHGGGQERNMRAGTENIYGIIGFAKALEIATAHHEKEKEHILGIKKYLKEKLTAEIPDIVFNGDPDGESLYTVLSAGFPQNDKTDMLLFNLDIRNICASGGSACSSGANQGSHVIAALKKDPQATIRFSFSKYNKLEEIDTLVSHLKELI